MHTPHKLLHMNLLLLTINNSNIVDPDLSITYVPGTVLGSLWALMCL